MAAKPTVALKMFLLAIMLAISILHDREIFLLKHKQDGQIPQATIIFLPATEVGILILPPTLMFLLETKPDTEIQLVQPMCF